MSWYPISLTLHLFFDMLWVGSTLAMAVLLLGKSETAEIAKARGEAALLVYNKVANPAFSLAFLLGGPTLLSLAFFSEDPT